MPSKGHWYKRSRTNQVKIPVVQAENKHKLLKKKLVELQNSSRNVAMEAAKFAVKSEELKVELAMKKNLKRWLMPQKCFMTDINLWVQMMDEVEVVDFTYPFTNEANVNVLILAKSISSGWYS